MFAQGFPRLARQSVRAVRESSGIRLNRLNGQCRGGGWCSLGIRRQFHESQVARDKVVVPLPGLGDSISEGGFCILACIIWYMCPPVIKKMQPHTHTYIYARDDMWYTLLLYYTLGAVVSWEKSVGESVKVDDVLLVVDTDKVSVDIRSPNSGVLIKQFVAVDDNV